MMMIMIMMLMMMMILHLSAIITQNKTRGCITYRGTVEGEVFLRALYLKQFRVANTLRCCREQSTSYRLHASHAPIATAPRERERHERARRLSARWPATSYVQRNVLLAVVVEAEGGDACPSVNHQSPLIMEN